MGQAIAVTRDHALKLSALLAEDTKEIDYFAVYIVIGLDRRRITIEQHSARSRVRFAVVMGFRKEWREPFEMIKLSPIPAEHDALAFAVGKRGRKPLRVVRFEINPR